MPRDGKLTQKGQPSLAEVVVQGPVRHDADVRAGGESGLGTRISDGWFSSEAAMMSDLAAGASLLFGRRRPGADTIDLFFEVPTAAGVPDMLLVRFDAQAIEARERLGLGPVIGAAPARVLTSLVDRRLDPARVASEIGITESHVRQSLLPALADAGLAVSVGDRCWTAAVGIRSLVESVVAIEVKRRDWKGALKQARRYSRFANMAFMVLDARGAAVALSHADDIVACGVGLATIGSEDRRVKVWRRPRWRNPRVPWESLLVGERLWELARAGRRSGPPLDVFGRPPEPTPDRMAGLQLCAESPFRSRSAGPARSRGVSAGHR